MELTKQQQQEGQEVINALIAKCWEDEVFKQALIDTPKETIESFTGKPFNLPEGKSLVVHDQTDDAVLHINIPAKPDLDSMELTDEQLEAVAGGVAPLVVYGAIFLGAVALGYFSGD